MQNTNQLRQPEPGDLLAADRVGYTHCGIADGKGGVFHFSKTSLLDTKPRIRQESFAKFAKQDKVSIENCPWRLPSEIIVQNANNSIGAGKYNLFRNNCEHFATWCQTGVKTSQQVQTFVRALLALLPLLLIFFIVIIFIKSAWGRSRQNISSVYI